MSKVAFRFSEKSQPHTFVSQTAGRLAEPRPPEWILSGSVVREWNEESVREILECLVPGKGRVMVMAKEHEQEVVAPVGDLIWEKERWYGTEYYVRRLEEEFFKKVR